MKKQKNPTARAKSTIKKQLTRDLKTALNKAKRAIDKIGKKKTSKKRK